MRLICLFLLLPLSTTSFAREFWANQLGGGPGEVLEYNLKYTSHNEIRYADVVSPTFSNGSFVYEIQSDGATTVNLPEPVDVGQLSLEDKSGNVTRIGSKNVDQNENAVDVLSVPPGDWLLKIRSERAEEEFTSGVAPVDSKFVIHVEATES